MSGDETPFLQSSEYNAGAYGKYVTETFVSSSVTAPRLNLIKPFTECDDGSYLFIAPRGEVVNSTLCILDASGQLVWTSDQYECTPGPSNCQAYNLQVQHYKSERYLTFWAGDNSVGGHGVGKYYMLDQHYQVYRTIVGVNGLDADLHTFYITPNGTAILSVYEVIEATLPRKQGPTRPGGRPPNTPSLTGGRGFIWDSLFQEIDLETGELLFQWRASDHFPFSESFDPMKTVTKRDPWDWFHINSVEKDDDGNYLISSRHLRTVALIDGKTGEPIWKLGGKANSFQDLSGGSATNYIGQHDAHWVPGNHNSVTFFDNRADWVFHLEHRSMGTRIELDFEHMTATLGMQYINPANVYSVSQGSYQTLPNGNVLIGYGNNGVMTEYDANGTILCDAYFEPAHDWTSGNVQSYRDLKFNWTGRPLTPPSLAFQNGSFYMSWLGSTEVRTWMLQHASQANGTYRELWTVPKEGFETRVDVSMDLGVRDFVQVTALDKDGKTLAVSDSVNMADSATVPTDEPWDGEAGKLDDLEDATEAEQVAEMKESLEDVQVLVVFAVLALISSLLLAWCCFGRRIWRPWRARFGADHDTDGQYDATPAASGALSSNAWHYAKSFWSRLAGIRSTQYRPLGQEDQGDMRLEERRRSLYPP